MAGSIESPIDNKEESLVGIYESMAADELYLEALLRDYESLDEEDRCIQLREMLDNKDDGFSIIEWEVVEGKNIPNFLVSFEKDVFEEKFGKIVVDRYSEDGDLIIELKSRFSDDTEITALEGLMEYLDISRREDEKNDLIPERKLVFDEEEEVVYTLFIPGIDSCSPSVLSLKNIYNESVR